MHFYIYIYTVYKYYCIYFIFFSLLYSFFNSLIVYIMDVVLEIGKREILIGVAGDTDPISIPISYIPTTNTSSSSSSSLESNFLSDHSITKIQYDKIISSLNESNQLKYQQYQDSLGTVLYDIEIISFEILKKLIYKSINSIPIIIKNLFIIDFGFSKILKKKITLSLLKYRIKSIVYIPAPPLFAIGCNRRNALIINEEWNMIYKVIDLRIIGEYDIEESIDVIIQKSDIDIRKILRENIINTKDTVGCWTACSLYVASTKNDPNWEEVLTKDYISQ